MALCVHVGNRKNHKRELSPGHLPMQHKLSVNWLHQKQLSKLPDSGILPFVKAKNRAANIAIRTNLKNEAPAVQVLQGGM